MKDNIIRLILLDRAGSKKSDTILGNTKFKTPCRSSCSQTSVEYPDKEIHIFDSSKFFDKTQSNIEIRREILECISSTSSGPHAIILVLNFAEGTAEELKYVQHLVAIFGEKIYKHFIVLLTKKDYLDYEVKNVNKPLQTFFDNLCENRVMEFDNKLKSNMRGEQVSTFLEKVSDVENKNGERFRKKIYEESKRILEEETSEARMRNCRTECDIH